MLAVHLISLGYVLACILLTDREVFAWIRGKKQVLERETIHHFHLAIWIGLLVLIGSGVVLLLPRWEYLLQEKLFIIKLLFVGILITNAFLMGRVLRFSSQYPFAELPWHTKRDLMVSGAISSISWVSAALIGFILFEF